MTLELRETPPVFSRGAWSPGPSGGRRLATGMYRRIGQACGSFGDVLVCCGSSPMHF